MNKHGSIKESYINSDLWKMARYQNGNLAPDMGSVFMPVDRCTRENSCLQVIPSFKITKPTLIGQSSV